MKPNPSADMGLLLYTSTLFVGGIVLIAATPSQGWGLFGYVGGGALAFVGSSMIVGRVRSGSSLVDFTCPLCDHDQSCARASLERGGAIPCASCQGYLQTRDGVMVALDDGEIFAAPTFEAPLPPTAFDWPRGCALCGSLPCEREEIQGTSLHDRCAITRSVSVPVCILHRGERAVALAQAEHLPGAEGFALRFRSHAAARRFRAANPVHLPAPRGALAFGGG